MQEFLKNDKVSCNLMSLTGYRMLIILYELIKSPKSLEELNASLKNNKYIDEKFSADTLRIYINSLRKFGCEISKATKKNDYKYKLLSHPFSIEITEKEAKAVRDILLKNNNLDIDTVIDVENFLEELISLSKSEKAIGILQKLLLTKNVNNVLLNELKKHCDKKNQIIFLYNSPKSGRKDIELLCEAIICKNRKLYLTGTDIFHQEYTLFPIERIVNVKTIKLHKVKEILSETEIICKIYSSSFKAENESEQIIEKNDDYITVKFKGRNKFELTQRILYLGEKCQVVSPELFKNELTDKLKQMEAIYG